MLHRLQNFGLARLAVIWDRLPKRLRRWVLFATNDHFLVGVVGLLVDDQNRVLLLEHRFRTPWRWGLPGGFISRGESFDVGLARELLEEINLHADIDPLPFDWEMSTDGSYVSLTMTGRVPAPPAALEIRSGEILSGGFYAFDALPDGLYPYHRTLIARHLKQGPH